MEQFDIGSNFGFSAVEVEGDKLNASSYTLIGVSLDMSGSMTPNVPECKTVLKTVNRAIIKSSQSDNMMSRVTTFNSSGVHEVHGFSLLPDIDEATYDSISAYGGTPLYDSVYSNLAAIRIYAEKLHSADFVANGILFVITDGMDTGSHATMKMIADEQEQIRTSEKLESLISILIGFGGHPTLAQFAKDAKFTHYIDAGNATPGKLAKLAAFVSTSIDSQSKAIGTGGPSQSIAATI